MASNIIYASGTAKWARVYESQMDTKYGEKFHLTLYPDKASLATMKEAGCRLTFKEDEEGTFVKVSRDNMKQFKDKLEKLGPPKVLDAGGNAFDKIIGNGSKVTVKLTVYDTVKGKGTRLEAVRVDEHVPYESANEGVEYPF
jgi:hypothetical protein